MSRLKLCKKCGNWLPRNNLYFHADGRYFYGICKSCRKCKVEIKAHVGVFIICTYCKNSLPATKKHFHISSREKLGLRSQCKTCRSELKRIYVEKNKDKIKLKNEEYRNKKHVKERILSISKTREHKDKVNNYRNNLYKSDPDFKLRHNLRTSFNRYIKNKRETTFKYIGLPFDEFKKYIAGLFSENMTWENYGKWHIDHITPLNYFEFHLYLKDKEKLESLIYEAWNYKNLQPLWARDNIIKSCKIIKKAVE